MLKPNYGSQKYFQIDTLHRLNLLFSLSHMCVCLFVCVCICVCVYVSLCVIFMGTGILSDTSNSQEPVSGL